MANVRDLLIRMSLDTTNYKTQIDAAKRELRLLKQEYAATASDKSLEDSAATLLANLQAQKAAIEAEIAAYQQGINTIKQKLAEVAPGSQNEQSLIKNAADLETKMKGAETALNNLESKISTMKMDNLLYQAQQLSTLFMSLKLGLSDALNFFGDAADSADDAFVRREAAFIQATKNVEDARQTKEDLDALNKGITEMATRIPQTYEQLAGLMGVGATLGVPYENLLEFTEVMAKLNVATNVAGEGGAQAMAQFLNITEKGYDNLARVGAALTELGNNSATTEQNILEMAHRASTGLSTVGMSTADILALSAALNSVGIEAQAGGSSISKLGITMDKAANVGAQNISRLLDLWNEENNTEYDNIYDLYAYIAKQPRESGWSKMATLLKMTPSDTTALMNSALAAERFSQAMGITVDQFAQGWNADAADQMLQFFISLGEMSGETEQTNMLWVMDQLGITEIRQSNMVRALANNWELYAHMLTLGRNAYEENVALENEAERAFGTYESQRAVNANKEENAAEAMGRSVAAMRQPWDDFFADIKQWYADWPTWAQNAVGGVSQTLGAAGDVLDWMGTVSFNALNIANAIKMLKDLGVGAKLAAAAPTLGKVALGAGAVAGAGLAAYGLYELTEYLTDLADKTDDVSATLAGLEIKIDPVSKEATLAAIKEVQDAADKLGGGGDMEKYANTSRVVQMGYGTSSMFGQALAYEAYKANQEIEAIYADYGARIQKMEKTLLDAQTETERAVAQSRITALTHAMEADVASAQQAYGETVNRVINGGLQAAGDPGKLESIAEKYNLLDQLIALWDSGARGYNYGEERKAYLDLYGQIERAGIDLSAAGNMSVGQDSWMSVVASSLYESLADDVKEVMGNGDWMAIAMAAMQSGALQNADQSQYSGAWLGLLAAMDIKSIGEQSTQSWTDIGKNSMLGLGTGITENQEGAVTSAEGAANDLIAAARRVLGINSPSTVFYAIGENIDLGLANGIYARADEVIAAASWLAGQVEATMRAALDINSPSGVARRMGVFLGEGLAQGIESSLGRVERAAGTLANGVSAAGKRPIDVTLNLDGRTLTEIMVPMMDQALGESMYE